MSWLNALKGAGAAMRSELDNMLTAAEERTPNLDSAPGWFGSGSHDGEEDGGAVSPRRLSQGDMVSAVALDNSGSLAGTVFSVDTRNELVTIIPDDGGMEVVLWSEARFYLHGADNKGGGENPRVHDPNREQVRREDMEDGVIYDAEIID